METEVASDREEGLVVWAEVDPLGATCSKEQGTGSVQIRVVETRTLPGVWSVTSVRLLNLRVLEVVLHSPLVVTEAEGAWVCAEAGVWIVVDQLEDQVAQDSVEAGEVTVEASEGGEAWIGEASGAVGDHLWTGWAAVEAEEWALLEAR